MGLQPEMVYHGFHPLPIDGLIADVFLRGFPTDSRIIQTNVCQKKGLAVSGMMGSMTLPPTPKAFATVSVDVGLAPRDCAGGPPFFSKWSVQGCRRR